MRGSLSESSQLIYSRTINQFLSFCKDIDKGFKGLPASAKHVLYFMAELFHNKSKYSSMASKVCIISYYHKIHSLPDPTVDYIVRRTLQGFKKLAEKPKSKIPVSIEMLQKLLVNCNVLGLSAY